MREAGSGAGRPCAATSRRWHNGCFVRKRMQVSTIRDVLDLVSSVNNLTSLAPARPVAGVFGGRFDQPYDYGHRRLV